MTKCRLCQHKNPPGTQRCEECGTWISQDVEPPPTKDKSTTGSESSESSSPPIVSELDKQLLALLKAGQKIAAVKLYREEKGTGLKESKEAVEAIAERHGVPRGSGCAGAVLFLIAASLAVAAAA